MALNRSQTYNIIFWDTFLSNRFYPHSIWNKYLIEDMQLLELTNFA